MHWLPLVAMVIASALPFPHSPVTTQPGSGSRRRDPAPPVDRSLRGNVSRTDGGAGDAPRPHVVGSQDRRGSVKPSVHRETSTAIVENQITFQTFDAAAADDPNQVGLDVSSLRTRETSEDNSLPEDGASRTFSSGVLDFSRDLTQQHSTSSPLQVSTVDNYDVVSPATMLKGQRGLEPTAPSGLKSRTGAGTGQSLTPEAGLGVGAELDGLLEGDDVFWNTHPRVLFSSSLLPPEHPPLQLMWESGQLEDGNEPEDLDRRAEGHGDRAIDRSATPRWANHSAPSKETGRPVRRDKRSHLMDRRRGEKAVCESESFWVIDKKTATDSYGDPVTIVPEIQTQKGPVKQFFYETRCREAEQQGGSGRTRGAAGRATGTGVAGAGCFGVDSKQWHSECKVKQSYVRALTKDANNLTGWRWIRVDSSCVCVLLSRANQRRNVLPRQGRG